MTGGAVAGGKQGGGEVEGLSVTLENKEIWLRYRVHSGNALNLPETRMTVDVEGRESQDDDFSEKLTLGSNSVQILSARCVVSRAPDSGAT